MGRSPGNWPAAAPTLSCPGRSA